MNLKGMKIEKAFNETVYENNIVKFNKKRNQLSNEPATNGQIIYIQQQLGIDASKLSKLEAGNIINKIKSGIFNKVKFGAI